MAKRKTNEEFLEEVYELVGDEYTFLEPYMKSNTKIKVRHNLESCDNYEYLVTPSKFLIGRRCPKCSGHTGTTSEMITERIGDRFGSDYSLLKDDRDSSGKIHVIHNLCGSDFRINVYSMLRKDGNGGCRKCASKAIGERHRFTHEQFLKNFRDVRDDLDEYTFLEEYKSNNTPIRTEHLVCGYIWNAYPTNLVDHKIKCPKCSNRLKKTQEQFENEIFKLVESEYTVIGEYKGANRKVGMRHELCGHNYMVTPSKFVASGRRCPKCFGKHKKTHTQFIKEVYSLVKDEYTVLTPYKGNKQKVLMFHSSCGFEWMVEPNKFLNFETRCPKCADFHRNDNIRRTQEEFEKEIHALVGDEYAVLGEYVNSKTKILMRHNNCGHEYHVNADSMILSGSRCPKCNSSKGEKRIGEFLDSVGVIYESQYTDSRCRYDTLLRFDFAVMDKIKPKLLIEYDGQQHYTPVEYWGGERALSEQIAKDKIKDDFCFQNDINLLRIPFWKYDDIEYIVFNKLIELGVLEEVEI